MTRWEYRIEPAQWTELTRLNELGGQGWELAMKTANGGGYIFKREVPPPPMNPGPG